MYLSNLPKNLKEAAHGRLSDALRGKDGKPVSAMPVPVTATGSFTLSVVQLLSWLVHGTPGGIANYTLPAAADVDAALGENFEVGEAFEINIVNLSITPANDITVVAGAGWTLVGPMAIEAREATQVAPSSGRFWARKTAAGAFTLYRVS